MDEKAYKMNKKESIIIGIDPGLQGYVCIMKYREGQRMKTFKDCTFTKMPLAPRYSSRDGKIVDVRKLDTLIEKGSLIFIEELFVGFKQSHGSIMTSSENLGRVLGLMELKECAIHSVQPRVWQRALSERYEYEWVKGIVTKENALNLAQRIFPGEESLFEKKVPKDGLVDSILIGIYGMHLLEEHSL